MNNQFLIPTNNSKAKRFFLSFVLTFSISIFSAVPVLNSMPGITNKVIYLDFDGQVVSGTGWNSGNTINALASTISTVNMVIVWKRVAEDFRPFDVNVTTDSVRFNNASPTTRTRIIITPTSAWFGSAGGVAYLNSFSWGGTPGTPCWVFENMLGYNAKNIAEACSHEAGHTLSLRHQSTYNTICVKTAEYNPGQGTGVTSWAPIMGVSYYNNVSTWFNGKSSFSCTTIQNDHGNVSPGITSPAYLSFLPDDVGNTYASGKNLNLVAYNLLDSGIITTPADIDVYRFSICNTRDITISVKPWALDTIGYNGANLDVRFQLFNALNNALIATDTSLTKLNTQVGLTLGPGNYYFTIDGGRSANYSDYGSLGKYYIAVKTTDPPFLNNTIISSATTCVGQTTQFSATSNGSPVYWLWNFAGPTPTISIIQNPSMTFATAGVYTVSLLAFNNFSASCEVTKTITVGALPSLTVSSNSTICPGTNVPVNAGGALFYSWSPGNFAGPVLILNPLVTTVYTITGSNNLCNSQAMLTISVTPDFSVNIATSSSVICSAQSATLTATGADTYTFNPGGTSTPSLIITPSVSTTYSVTGSNGYCSKSASKFVKVSPDFTVNVNPSDTILCEGESILLLSSGANNYTIEPGSISTNPVIFTPTASVVYTITGTNIDNCSQQVISNLNVSACTYIESRNEKSDAFQMYPNPANTQLTIITDLNVKRFSVVNMLGELMIDKTGNISKTIQLDVNDWLDGIYIFKIRLNGNETISRKLVVRHN